MYFLFLLKFVNIYLEQQKTKNGIAKSKGIAKKQKGKIQKTKNTF